MVILLPYKFSSFSRFGIGLRRGAVILLLAAALGRPACAQDNSTAGPSTNSAPAAAPDTFYPGRPELNTPTPSAPDHSLSLQSGVSSGENSKLAPPDAGNSSGGLHLMFPEGQPEALPAHLLVVYNSNDPDSQALATYYAARRALSAEQVLGIPCSAAEEISRDEYEKTIREPIISYIYRKGWMTRRTEVARLGNRQVELLVATHNDVWAIALIRGVPLKIAHDPAYASGMEREGALQTNAAAVDSELALLPIFGLPLGGFVPNSFYDGIGSGNIRAGPELANRLIFVTRLDGPTPADVRRMIDDTLYAEENRLAGLAVIDTRGLTDVKNPYTIGDLWLRRSADLLARDGWPVRLDNSPDVLPPSDPCNQVALYLGWYRDGAFGPWVTPPNRFVRGAIAYHLHSFSALTVRSATQDWVGPLIAHGAAATMGAVYEPYLDMTPHLNIFTRRLLAGDYFAEAAYASQPGLSWMITTVGDPLYRPFRKPINTALAETDADPAHHDWLLLQRVQRAIAGGQVAFTMDNLERYLDAPDPVIQEGLGDLLEKIHDPDAMLAAEGAYRNAVGLEEQPIDRIRVGLKLAQAYVNNGQSDQAQAELKSLRESDPADASRFGVADPLVPTGAPASTQNLTPVSASPMAPPQAPGPPRPPSP